MNISFALLSTPRGPLAYADLDFTAIGFVAGSVTGKNYFTGGGIGNTLLSSNTLAFPQISNVFTVKGLRYFYRPYWSTPIGDLQDSAFVTTNIPIVYVYNPSNNDTEVIGLTRTPFDNFWGISGAVFEPRIQTPIIQGAADFECTFQDSIDVSSIVNIMAGGPFAPTGRIQLQFTSFEVQAYSKMVNINTVVSS
jgi:hypothetical protein